MKKLIIALIFLCGMGFSQNTPTIGMLPDSGPNLPATCVVGQIYFKTTATAGLNQCATANTWTAAGGGGGTGTVTVVGAGALTSTAFVTGGGTTTLQTPSATSTLSAGGNASFAGTLAASGHVTFEGVTSTGATGTGGLVFSISPTFTGTLTGAAAVFSTSIATGTAPVACGTAAGCYAATEGTASNMTITASQDAFAADATAHAFKMTLNGGAIFLSAMNASLAPTGTIAGSFASGPAGGKCAQTSGTAGLLVEAAGACGSSTPSLDQVTGSAAQATATETAISHEWTYAGVETANLTYPIVFQNTNATNTTSGALAVNVVGAGTAMVPLTINQPATDVGNIIQGINGGTFTNGVESGGTINWAITSTGAGIFGAATNPTTGTSGGAVAIEGTAFTGTSTNYGWYNDSTLHCLDVIDQTTNIGCAVGETAIIAANAIPKAVGTTSKITASALSDNVLVTSTEFVNFASNRVFMTADWTCGTGGTTSSCAAATIVGTSGTPLTLTLPLSAQSWHFHCHVIVTDTTGTPANNWAMITATNGATNVTASYSGFTAAAVASGGSTTDTAVTTSSITIGGTWTQGATATKMPYDIDAWIEGASASGTVVSLQVIDPTVADLLTIYRGAYCTVGPF